MEQKYQLGDTFIVTGGGHSSGVEIGDLVTFIRDDGSNCPYFQKEGSIEQDCISWSSLTFVDNRQISFILSYALDTKAFEAFVARKQVEDRIKELAKRSDLKKDSIKVYEIAKTYDITLETRIVFDSKVTLTEIPKKKRGRPAKK